MSTTAAPAIGPRFMTLDTADAPPRERFEQWRALFPQLDMAPQCRSEDYRASATACADETGVLLTRVRVAPTMVQHAEGHSDQFMLNLFLDGNSQARHGRHETQVGAGTGFSLSDCARPLRTLASAHHESIHLFLPRARVTQLLGRHPTGDTPWRHLPDSPLGEVLKAHLLALTRHGTALDGSAVASCLDATTTLALACLAGLGKAEATPDLDALLFEGACRYIDAHLHDSGLTVRGVAHAMHTSRARLYRVFAERGLTIAGNIRARRLACSRHLLRDSRMGIGEVALHCGYGDQPAFSKAFKRSFGLTPSECRLGAPLAEPAR